MKPKGLCHIDYDYLKRLYDFYREGKVKVRPRDIVGATPFTMQRLSRLRNFNLIAKRGEFIKLTNEGIRLCKFLFDPVTGGLDV